MSAETIDISHAIQATTDRHSRQGRFLRYTRGRINHFWPRALMYVGGSAVLWYLVGPNWALLTLVLAFGGEALDCWFCSRAERWLSDGYALTTLMRASVFTAAFQAFASACCILIAWFFIHTHNAFFFCLVYLASTTINAGVLLPFNRPATIARLGIYAATLVIIFITEFTLFAEFTRHNALDLVGVGMMVFMIISFVNFVGANQRRQKTSDEKLLETGRELQALNLQLERKHIDLRNLALVAQHANDSVVITDPAGKITWVNDAFTNLTGFTRGEAFGISPGELLNGPETSGETVAKMNATLKRGEKCRAEILNYSKSGQQMWVETNLVPVMDDTGQVETVIAIERDITGFKNHADELASARDAAETAAQEKADFLATMSHEIRTPMNAILGMSELLGEKVMDDESQLYVETIHGSANALLKIINNVLDMSKLDAGKLEMSNVDFDLPTCLRSATEMFRPLTREKDLNLTVELPKDLPTIVHGDDGRLRQIILNILGNAIKFTPEGTIKVVVSHKVAGDHHALTIDVHDQGHGISADEIELIFDEFAQAKGDTARNFGGTGLGLSISRKLAKEMGGDISASSVVGLGSIFTINLLLEPVKNDTQEQVVSLNELRENIPAGIKVLVADDNATNRLLIKKFLKDCPVSLEFAFNGVQAVEMANSCRPDLVFMDLLMPEMGGLEATAKLRVNGFDDLRIIALTANSSAEDRAECMEAGMDGFLTKPIRKADLFAALVEFGDVPAQKVSAFKLGK